jgi:hypothetical protein
LDSCWATGCCKTPPASAHWLLVSLTNRSPAPLVSLSRAPPSLPCRAPQAYSYDLRPLCNIQDYTGTDDKGHTYAMNICGTTSAKCLPSE